MMPPETEYLMKRERSVSRPEAKSKIIEAICESEAEFTVETDDGKLVHAKYITKDGHELYFVSNRARNAAHVKCARIKDGIRAKTAMLLNPDDGGVAEIPLDEPFTVPAARAVFLMF